jgi:hypothetical protein
LIDDGQGNLKYGRYDRGCGGLFGSARPPKLKLVTIAFKVILDLGQGAFFEGADHENPVISHISDSNRITDP